MFVLLSLVVCLSGTPSVCETVTPGYVDRATGRPPTLLECLGVTGQAVAHRWLSENPGYLLRRVQCSVANDPVRLRDRVEGPKA